VIVIVVRWYRKVNTPLVSRTCTEVTAAAVEGLSLLSIRLSPAPLSSRPIHGSSVRLVIGIFAPFLQPRHQAIWNYCLDLTNLALFGPSSIFYSRLESLG
jgi:hypothetical protein